MKEVRRIAALSGVLVLILSSPALAAEIQGTLLTIHRVAGQVVFEQGSTLALNADTQIWVKGRQGGLVDLQPGQEITATFRREDGQNVATRIDVAPGGVSRLARTGSARRKPNSISPDGQRSPHD